MVQQANSLYIRKLSFVSYKLLLFICSEFKIKLNLQHSEFVHCVTWVELTVLGGCGLNVVWLYLYMRLHDNVRQQQHSQFFVRVYHVVFTAR